MTAVPTSAAAANARIDHSSIGRPASVTSAFGPSVPSLSPIPAAGMTAVADGAPSP
jgi:hypothetical protein